jgi:hypothetical protein
MFFLSCLFPDKITDTKNLQNKVNELEIQNLKLQHELYIQAEELSRLKRSQYSFLGTPINNINQRVLV